MAHLTAPPPAGPCVTSSNGHASAAWPAIWRCRFPRARNVIEDGQATCLAIDGHRLMLPPRLAQAESIWSDIWHQEAHPSTALEGNTLVLREVQMLLDQGRAVGAKPLKEYNEVKGYADAARWGLRAGADLRFAR